jgi:hypothetical protein
LHCAQVHARAHTCRCMLTGIHCQQIATRRATHKCEGRRFAPKMVLPKRLWRLSCDRAYQNEGNPPAIQVRTLMYERSTNCLNRKGRRSPEMVLPKRLRRLSCDRSCQAEGNGPAVHSFPLLRARGLQYTYSDCLAQGACSTLIPTAEGKGPALNSYPLLGLGLAVHLFTLLRARGLQYTCTHC